MYVLQLFGLLLAACTGTWAYVPGHFEDFYTVDGWGDIVRRTKEDHCMPEFHAYETAAKSQVWAGTADEDHAWNFVRCMLNHLDELTKANMGLSALVLGLMPTVFSLIGSSTIETGLLSLRRPILASLISAASPMANPLHAAEYRNPLHPLRMEATDLLPPLVSRSRQIIVLLVQYLVAILAVGNVAHMLWELVVKATFSADVASIFYTPVIWGLVGLVIHAIGWISLRLRLRVNDASRLSFHDRIRQKLIQEWCLCAYQPLIIVIARPTTYWFVCIEWIGSSLIVLNMVWGTYVFGSVLLVGPRAALIIASRFFASTILARVVLMVELTGMKHRLQVDKASDLVEHAENEPPLRVVHTDRKGLIAATM